MNHSWCHGTEPGRQICQVVARGDMVTGLARAECRLVLLNL